MESCVDYRFNIINCEKPNSQFNFGKWRAQFARLVEHNLRDNHFICCEINSLEFMQINT